MKVRNDEICEVFYFAESVYFKRGTLYKFTKSKMKYINL